MTHRIVVRPLDGIRVGLSVSESEDVAGLGFDSVETNRATRELSLAILSQGGSLAFGHDWREEGVMASLFAFALDYQLPTLSGSGAEPPIRNYVPWPSKSSVSRDHRRRFQDVIEIHEVRPDGIKADSEASLASRVKSLSHMRQILAEAADARIAIGGRTSGSGGRAAGVVEEILLTLRSDRPVYLSGLYGGATQQVINVITGVDDPNFSAFRPRPDVAKAFGEQQLVDGFGIHPVEFANFPLERIAANNGLNPDDNMRLFKATELNEVIGYVLQGLARVKSHKS